MTDQGLILERYLKPRFGGYGPRTPAMNGDRAARPETQNGQHHVHQFHFVRAGVVGPQNTLVRQPDAPNFVRPGPGSWLLGAGGPAPNPATFAMLSQSEIAPAFAPMAIPEAAAALMLITALPPNPIPQIECLRWSPLSSHDKESIPFYLFDEFDQLLFRGVLRNNVCLQWEYVADRQPRPPPIEAAEMHEHSLTVAPEVLHQRTTIILHNYLLYLQPYNIVAALIHAMTHAYFILCSGHRSPTEGPGKHDLRHGLPFSAATWAISEILNCRVSDDRLLGAAGELETLPNLFNCWHLEQVYPVANVGLLGAEELGAKRCSRFREAIRQVELGRSHCCFESMGASESRRSCNQFLHDLRDVKYNLSGDGRIGSSELETRLGVLLYVFRLYIDSVCFPQRLIDLIVRQRIIPMQSPSRNSKPHLLTAVTLQPLLRLSSSTTPMPYPSRMQQLVLSSH